MKDFKKKYQFFYIKSYKGSNMKNMLKLLMVLFIIITFSCSKSKNDSSNKNEKTCKEMLHENGKKITLTAKNYNKYGFRAYKMKKYERAVKFFRCAIETDANHILANYNLACTLSILYGKNKSIDTKEIFALIRKTLNLDKNRIRKTKSDPDFKSIRHLDEFKKIISEYSIDDNEEQIRKEQEYLEIENQCDYYVDRYGNCDITRCKDGHPRDAEGHCGPPMR